MKLTQTVNKWLFFGGVVYYTVLVGQQLTDTRNFNSILHEVTDISAMEVLFQRGWVAARRVLILPSIQETFPYRKYLNLGSYISI